MRMIFRVMVNATCYRHAGLACKLIFSLIFLTYLITANADENNAKVNADKLSAEILVETVVPVKVLSEQILYAEQWELTRSGESVLSSSAIIKQVLPGYSTRSKIYRYYIQVVKKENSGFRN